MSWPSDRSSLSCPTGSAGTRTPATRATPAGPPGGLGAWPHAGTRGALASGASFSAPCSTTSGRKAAGSCGAPHAFGASTFYGRAGFVARGDPEHVEGIGPHQTMWIEIGPEAQRDGDVSAGTYRATAGCDNVGFPNRPPGTTDVPRSIGVRPMPDAVIVATARTPIGRAIEELTRRLPSRRPGRSRSLRAVMAKVPQLERRRDRRRDHRVRSARRRSRATTSRRVAALLAGVLDVPGVTVNRYCSSSLQTIRMAAHAIQAGRGTAPSSAAGVETVSRFGQGASDVGSHNVAFAS